MKQWIRAAVVATCATAMVTGSAVVAQASERRASISDYSEFGYRLVVVEGKLWLFAGQDNGGGTRSGWGGGELGINGTDCSFGKWGGTGRTCN